VAQSLADSMVHVFVPGLSQIRYVPFSARSQAYDMPGGAETYFGLLDRAIEEREPLLRTLPHDRPFHGAQLALCLSPCPPQERRWRAQSCLPLLFSLNSRSRRRMEMPPINRAACFFETASGAMSSPLDPPL
jgi:hypothetical protein